ncbi:hypothetical protein M011DRAFT_466722 [Sporormia fimetaria CBS 119925]|uniref:Uncharacterized protein n=1 Tax=Sporormia fimetaria CBS 119925 TaxID=1340428 RepID=A0A6A6VCN2_9PLEO|nr:hypothetical protein M011DRAFT_466722 [Sporormia fimetaria CBS 119925]
MANDSSSSEDFRESSEDEGAEITDATEADRSEKGSKDRSPPRKRRAVSHNKAGILVAHGMSPSPLPRKLPAVHPGQSMRASQLNGGPVKTMTPGQATPVTPVVRTTEPSGYTASALPTVQMRAPGAVPTQYAGTSAPPQNLVQYMVQHHSEEPGVQHLAAQRLISILPPQHYGNLNGHPQSAQLQHEVLQPCGPHPLTQRLAQKTSIHQFQHGQPLMQQPLQKAPIYPNPYALPADRIACLQQPFPEKETLIWKFWNPTIPLRLPTSYNLHKMPNLPLPPPLNPALKKATLHYNALLNRPFDFLQPAGRRLLSDTINLAWLIISDDASPAAHKTEAHNWLQYATYRVILHARAFQVSRWFPHLYTWIKTRVVLDREGRKDDKRYGQATENLCEFRQRLHVSEVEFVRAWIKKYVGLQTDLFVSDLMKVETWMTETPEAAYPTPPPDA